VAGHVELREAREVSGKRIRTIKPEWLEDERLATCSDTARMVSVALIVLADDYGNGRAHHLYLTSRIWPYASCDTHESLARVSRALHELVAIGFAQLYEIKGQTYYNLTNWKRHQRIDRPSQPLVPSPNGKDATLTSGSRKTRDGVASPSRDTRAGLGIGIGIGGGRAIPVPGSSGSAPCSSSATTPTPTTPREPSQNFTEPAIAAPTGKAAEPAKGIAENGPSLLWEIWQELAELEPRAAPSDQVEKLLAAAWMQLGKREPRDPEGYFRRMVAAYIEAEQKRGRTLELMFFVRDFPKWAEFVARATSNGPSTSLLPAYQPYPDLDEVRK
jgi:hypothetical protein